jgi:GNAT superfamily N-acetyltransferase
MSETAQSAPRPMTGAATSAWRVRPAGRQDLTAIVAAVSCLLEELGATPPAHTAMEAATQALLNNRKSGALFVAEGEEELIGVLSASWQSAIHIPGRYALIQDLWVERGWRSEGIGAALIEALADLASRRGVARIEVGLPRESFAGLAATEAFYTREGFAPLGPRMRRLLP